MRLFGGWLFLLAVIVGLPAKAEGMDFEAVNRAAFDAQSSETARTIKAQILLDRKRYSPGVIDGVGGGATEVAVRAFQADHGLAPSGKLDAETFARLTEGDPAPVLTRYTISKADAKGPFEKTIPESIAEMAKLDTLAFTGPHEALAERFHMDESLLEQLNPDADFSEPGTEIVVSSVAAEGRSATGDEKRAERIVVDKSDGTLRVLDKDGGLVALYPATIGSENNPAPDGETKIERIARGPTWNYDPKLSLEGHKDRPDKPLTIAAGPNNPVGTVWIALDRDRYGIHGTAEPEKIGKSVSSGCVRLTNWDVEELAGLARKGMVVEFRP